MPFNSTSSRLALHSIPFCCVPFSKEPSLSIIHSLNACAGAGGAALDPRIPTPTTHNVQTYNMMFLETVFAASCSQIVVFHSSIMSQSIRAASVPPTLTTFLSWNKNRTAATCWLYTLSSMYSALGLKHGYLMESLWFGENRRMVGRTWIAWYIRLRRLTRSDRGLNSCWGTR